MCRFKKVPRALLTVLLVVYVVAPVSILVAQRPGPAPSAGPNEDAVISDANFSLIAQQIRDLKNPTFRALLRIRIVSWVPPADNRERRQAALSVTSEGLADLCAQQDEVWRPTASWLYESLTRAARNLDPAGAELNIGKCTLKKDESVSDAARDLAAAVDLLGDPAKASGAVEKAKAAIMTGQVQAGSLLGHLLRLQKTNPTSLPELLSAMLFTEEQHPGFIPLQFMDYFTPFFLEKSNATELQGRFLLAAIRSTRLSPEELANPIIRSRVVQLLRRISEPTKVLAPALYPELATRLNSLGGANNAYTQRQAVEERIRASSDQLEQLQSEAEKMTDRAYQRVLLERAAQMALTQGKLRKAIDLMIASQEEAASGSSASLDRFLAEVNRAAIKQKQTDVAEYAISKMGKPLPKANAWLTLGNYYAEAREMEKNCGALNDAARFLKQADNGNDKLKSAIAIAQGFLVCDRSAAYDAFHQAVDTINKLPAPEKEKEKTYYASLMPIAEELIKTFRSLAAQDGPAAMALAQEIKLAELRVAALSGVYSAKRAPAVQIK